MKHFRMLAAGLCSAVLLCGSAIPAYAYSDSGNEEPLLWKKLRPRSLHYHYPGRGLFGGWKPCDPRSAL